MKNSSKVLIVLKLILNPRNSENSDSAEYYFIRFWNCEQGTSKEAPQQSDA